MTTDIQTLGERARELAGASRSENTKRAYRADWARFLAFCDNAGVPALPAAPHVVAHYAAVISHLKPATVQRYLSSIMAAHKLAGFPVPIDATVAAVVSGHRRTAGTRPRQVAPITTAILIRMVGVLSMRTMIDIRDRALLLLGFACALRRSELVALRWCDVEDIPGGLRILVHRGKGDQEGAGYQLDVPPGHSAETCPVRALGHWQGIVETIDWAGYEAPEQVFMAINRHGLFAGPLSPGDVARRIKVTAKRAGLDPAQYSGHSLRAGFATSAAAVGVPLVELADHTRHTQLNTLRRYIRAARDPRTSPAGKVGL